MFLFNSYSCCYELEYSHFDMLLICVLVYSPYIMFISCLAMCRLLSLYVVFRLVHSLHIMYMLRWLRAFMFMSRTICVRGWWFIMPSGAQVSYLSIRRVRDPGDLGGHYICGRGARVYSDGWMHFMSHGWGVRWQVVTALSIPWTPPHSAMV
jgi:hypothetical protein